MYRPVAVEPTCATTSRSCSTSSAPTVPSPVRWRSTSGGRCPAMIPASSAPVAGVRSLGLVTTVFPVTSAAPMSPQATATGSFHGVIAATTPRGSNTIRSSAPCCPARERPRCAGPSCAYWRSVSIPAWTPARGSASGRPISRVVSRASSSARSATAAAARSTAAARSPGAVRTQPGSAARAAATAATTSSSPATGTSTTTDPSAGSSIVRTRPTASVLVTAAAGRPGRARLRSPARAPR